ncbi:MAG: transcription antitermination factor NusB [Lachnospiraceae bacterium]|nr:transcription antitermination factor NusB [Lachnospiraceae bacterium]
MNRRSLREHVFQMLFRVEFFEEGDIVEQLDNFMEESEPISAEDAAHISEKFNKIKELLPEIDKEINDKVKGWKTSRMGKVDLAIIRLALYEIKYDDEVPMPVAINEAVELAKKYGTDESPAFINGVLAKLNER